MSLKGIIVLGILGFSFNSFALDCQFAKGVDGRVIYNSQKIKVIDYVNVEIPDLLNSDGITARIVGFPGSLMVEITHVPTGWTAMGSGDSLYSTNLMSGNYRYLIGCH